MKVTAIMAMASPKKRIVTHKNCKICQRGTICQALEKELAKLNSHLQSKAAKPYLGIENLPSPRNEETKEAQLFALVEKLHAYALPDIYIEVIVHVCVNNWDFSEIAEALHIVSWQQARAIYNQGLELLKERGYK